MKRQIVFLLAAMLISVVAWGQTGPEKRVSMELKSEPLGTALKKLGKVSGCKMLFSSEDVAPYRVTLSIKKQSPEAALRQILRDKPFKYKRSGDFITITKTDAGDSGRKHTRLVKGRVLDDEHLPLPGANIHTLDNQAMVVSDNRGGFEITVGEGELALEVTYIGMRPFHLNIQKGDYFEVNMEEEHLQLNDVVVTGYQTIEKGRATGSFSIVDKKELRNIYSTDVRSRLEGLVPGLEVGKNGTLEIRGVSSLNTTTRPLIVVDGYPLESSTLNLNPNDIEQVSVLKDAASASIWGIRAANGVVVITTKRGANNKRAEVSYNGTVSLAGRQRLSDLHLLNASEYAETLFDRYMAVGYTQNGVWGGYNEIAEQYLKYKSGDITEEAARANVARIGAFDNRKQLEENFYQQALVTQHNLSIRNGNERSSTFVSLNYDYTKSGQVGNDNNKFNVLLNNDFDFSKRLSLQVNVRGTYQHGHANAESVLGYMPWQRVLNDDGSYYHEYSESISQAYKEKVMELGFKDWNYNVLQMQRDNDNTTDNLNLTTALRLSWKPIKGLELASQVSYELGRTENVELYSEEHYVTRNLINTFTEVVMGSDGYPTAIAGHHFPVSGGIKETDNVNMHSYVWRNTAQYGNQFGDYYVKAMLGTEMYSLRSKSNYNRLWGYNDDMLTSQSVDLATLQGGVKGYNGRTQTLRWSPYIAEVLERYVSYFGTASVSYKNRYDGFVSLRLDETNLLTNASKYRNNPAWSVGGKWNVSNEGFFRRGVFDYLSLRASYGLSGNINKSTSPDIVVMTANDSYLRALNMLVVTNPSNPQLGWEKTYTFNVGADFSLWHGRLSGTLDYYVKNGKDLLANVQSLDPTTGWSSFYKNSASMVNRGIDLSLRGMLLNRQNLTWTAQLNFSYNYNKVTDLLYTPTVNTLLFGGYLEGKPSSSLFAIRYGGLDDNGEPTFMKAGDDTKYGYKEMSDLTIDDLKDMGRTAAPFFGSLQTSLRVNDFTFGVMFTYKLGHKMRLPATTTNTLWTEWFGSDYRWTEGGDNTGKWVPKMYTDTNMAPADYDRCLSLSDQLVDNAGVIRLRSLSAEYDISPFMHVLCLKGGSIRLSGENLWCWVANKYDLDPDTVSTYYGGLSLGVRPSFIATLNLSF